MSAVRIALLTEIPAPFRIPLFNALAAETGVEFEALFLSERDPKRPYPMYADEFRFEWRLLPGREVLRGGRWVVLSWGVRRALRRFRPSVIVIGGWNQPAFWTAAVYAQLARVPLVAWVESTERDRRSGSPLTELPKRALVRSCDAFLVPGRASAQYLESLGVAPELITTAPNAVDPVLFQERVDELRERRDELRSELDIEGPLVLYVGRLDHEKGVDLLLRAAESLPVAVAIVGRGPEEAALRRLAPPNVRFVGWVPRDELPRWYAAADVFVLPARSEQWGMVLNEAAAGGLPLVASEAPGAAQDLVEHGVNGFRVPVGDATALREALRALLDDADLRTAAGRRSRVLAARFTPDRWAAAVAGTVAALGPERPERPGLPRG
jgi:glycosyltransferase involved in cell wall biosynthesis